MAPTSPPADPRLPPRAVRAWVDQCAALCRPDRVVWLDGSAEERRRLLATAVEQRVLVPLDAGKRPDCYLHRSNPNDVARTEHLTFVCTPTQAEAGPTNNWWDPAEATAKLRGLFDGCMAGRTMYVVPFVMGPIGSPMARVGVELTDSVYVAVSMAVMTRMGVVAWQQLADGGDFTRCLHSLGDVNPDRRYVCHWPQDDVIWSFGSGYGGNALLGKKCLALRLASAMGHRQGWMAEHMLLMGVTAPGGTKTYVAAAFPSACGKTNFAMLVPPARFIEQGWRVTTVGDDIVWMWPDEQGRLRAVNPEAGYFGVVPGTSEQSNPNAVAAMARGTIFTNVALTDDGDVWWEGKTPQPPAHCLDWKGDDWTPGCGRPAAHPNSRFTSPMANNPALDEHADDPAGVPVSAIVFGGRRATTVPLVYQAFDWPHGVYLGATLGSETTAAATDAVGVLRFDPMAMRPFLGYAVGDYFAHWLAMGRRLAAAPGAGPPPVFQVNWFRKDAAGRFLWPGFGQNMRVLAWIVGRVAGTADARRTPLGWMPSSADLDLAGLDGASFDAAEAIDPAEVRAELVAQAELFQQLGGGLPPELTRQHDLLAGRL